MCAIGTDINTKFKIRRVRCPHRTERLLELKRIVEGIKRVDVGIDPYE